MSWQQCVDEQLIAGGYLTSGAILGHNGIVWASNNLTLKNEEIAKLLAGFADSVSVMKGTINVNGSRYTPVKANAKAIYGKQGAGGVVCVKTAQTIVVGIYKKPGKAIVVVEKLGEYLRESGY